MPPKIAKTRPLQLTYKQSKREVVVTPEDEDRYVTTVDEMIQSYGMSHLAISLQNELTRRFTELTRHCATWLQNHDSKVKSAHLTMRDAGFLFLVVRNTKPYDREFEEQLTEFDLRIARDEKFEMFNLSVLALPCTSQENIDSFISQNLDIRFARAE